MIDLSNMEQIKMGKTSSRGNQNKWFLNNSWYKMDTAKGYEGLSEYLVSCILEKSNYHNYIPYSLEHISLFDEVYTGCVSTNYCKNNEMLIPLQRFLRHTQNIELNILLNTLSTPLERIKQTVSYMEKAGIYDFGKYLTLILELDSFTINQDRHTNNISLLKRDHNISVAPIYDNGDSFFSDTMYFPMRYSIEELVRRIEAKPFSGSLDKQKEIAEELYGHQLQIYFSKDDLTQVLDIASSFYSDDILNRVKDLVLYQMERYKNDIYLPSNPRQSIIPNENNELEL